MAITSRIPAPFADRLYSNRGADARLRHTPSGLNPGREVRRVDLVHSEPNWQAAEAIAGALIERETLTRDDVIEIIVPGAKQRYNVRATIRDDGDAIHRRAASRRCGQASAPGDGRRSTLEMAGQLTRPDVTPPTSTASLPRKSPISEGDSG